MAHSRGESGLGFSFNCDGDHPEGERITQRSEPKLFSVTDDAGNPHHINLCGKCARKMQEYVEKEESRLAIEEKKKPFKRKGPDGRLHHISRDGTDLGPIGQPAPVAVATPPRVKLPFEADEEPVNSQPIEHVNPDALTMVLGKLLEGQDKSIELLSRLVDDKPPQQKRNRNGRRNRRR